MAESAGILSVSKPWHEELALFLIGNPHLSLGQVAAHFDVTPSWLACVRNSDAFRDYYEARRAEVNSMASVSLSDKVHALAELGVEALQQELVDHANGKFVPNDFLLDATEMALKSLGFGSKNTPTTPTNNTMILVGDQEALREARQTMGEVRRLIHDQGTPSTSGTQGVQDGQGTQSGQGKMLEHPANLTTPLRPPPQPPQPPQPPPPPDCEAPKTAAVDAGDAEENGECALDPTSLSTSE